MGEKEQIFKKLLPIAALEALTKEAVDAAPQGMIIEDLIVIREFPFRIGRESRVRNVNGKIERIERQKLDNREPTNDLYLVDRGHLLNISREHLLIDRQEVSCILADRGSACGTKVNDVSVGGDDTGGTIELKDGDIITVGTKDSPYRYRFVDLGDFKISKND